MFRVVHRVLLASIVLMLAFMLSSKSPVASAQSSITATVAYDNLNVRAEPRTDAVAVGQLDFEATVTVIAREDQEVDGRLWVWITTDALSGWVDSEYLAFPDTFVVGWLPVNNDLRVETASVDGSVASSNAEWQAIHATLAFNNVNLRRWPHETADVIGQFELGKPLLVHCREDFRRGGTWVYVTIDGQTGWILSDYILYPHNFIFETLSIGYGDGYPATPEIIQVRIATNLYSSSTRNREAIAVIPAGEFLYIQGQEDGAGNGYWYYVEWQGYTGWVSWRDIRFTGAEEHRFLDVQFYSFSRSHFPKKAWANTQVSPLQNGAAMGFSRCRGCAYVPAQNTNCDLLSFPNIERRVLNNDGYIIGIAYRGTYVRQLPSLDAEIIDQVSTWGWSYEVVVVYGQDTTGEWYYVREIGDDFSGWMSAHYINIGYHQFYINGERQRTLDITSVPIVSSVVQPPLPEPRQTVASMSATTRTETVLRLLPASRYRIIYRLPEETPLEVIGRNLYTTYFEVLYNGQRYWVCGTSLNFTGDPTQLGISHTGDVYWSYYG